MKIGIDARFLGPEGTGIGRYVEKLLENLEEIDKVNQYQVILRKSNFHLYSPKNANFQKITADAKWYGLKEQLILPAVLNKEKLDLVHFPHFNIPLLYRGKFIVTIHDLTQGLFADKASSTRSYPIFLAKHSAYKITINQALSRSAKILVPSEFVKMGLMKRFEINSQKIVVTYEGADDFLDPNFSPSEGRIKEVFGKYGLKKTYIVFVGNTFPYKNVEVILESLKYLPTELNFVCVGTRNTFLKKIITQAENLGVKNRFFTPGFVPDPELKVIINQASAFVFPSLSEGFGLPGLEAMGVGTPVIAAEATSLPEIYGEAAVYFDPKNAKELAKKITTLMGSETQRQELIAQGYQQVRKYSWKSLAEQTLSVYNEVLDQNYE